jgi:eukaryotic-like serine/threonine-protein kinase
VLAFGAYRFDPGNRILSRGDEELPLPPRALGVLAALLEEPGAVVSKQALLASVWNGAYVSETSLSEAVGLLRQALEDDPQEPTYIQTVHRRGYRFIAPVTEEDAAYGGRPARIPADVPSGGTPVSTGQDARRHAGGTPAVRIALMAALVIVAGGAFLAGRRSAPPPSQPKVTRYTIGPAAGEQLEWWSPGVAVSPDGQHVIYAVRHREATVLVHRDISGFSSRELAGTRGAFAPFFSPDGRRVGFYADGKLLAIPLAGGPAVPLVSALTLPFAGASWGADDTVVFAGGTPSSLYRVKPGGTAERLTRPDPAKGEAEHRWPHLLPGGEALLFTSWSTTLLDARVEWLSLATGERRTVLTGASDARFADGMLVCGRTERSVVAAKFDPRRGQLTGPVLPLLHDAAVLESAGVMQLAIGGRTLAYMPWAQGTPFRRLQRLGADGKLAPLPGPPRFYKKARPGPQGKIAATIMTRGRSDIWIVDSATGTPSRLTFAGFNTAPFWSPDGKWVAFASKTGGPFNLYRRRADGSGAAERLTVSPHDHFPLGFSPDGRELMLVEVNPSTSLDLLVLDVATRNVRPWLRTNGRETLAAWSPDGKWIVYATAETGTWELYVRHPAGAGRWHLSPDGAIDASWSEDGRELLLLRLAASLRERELWSIPVTTPAGEFKSGPPRKIYAAADMIDAVAGPGGVVVITEDAKPPDPAEVRVMRDWISTLPAALGRRR